MHFIRMFLTVLLLTVVSSSLAVSSAAEYKKLDYEPRVYDFESKYADINGINICYIDEGAGDQVIIFVHGLSGTMYNFMDSIRYYSKSHRVVALDLPGHGNSERRNDIDYGIPLFADTIAGLMDHLGIEKAVIAGISMGGHSTAYFAWKYPKRTIAAVLIDAAGLGTNFPSFAKGFMEKHPEWIAKKMTKMTRKSLAKGKKPMLGGPANDDGKHGGKFPMFWDASKPKAKKWNDWNNAYMEKFYWTEEFPKFNYALVLSSHSILSVPMNDKLADINVPTLIIWGNNDGLVDIQCGFEYARGIRGSMLVVIQDCGHVPPVEEPEQFFAALDKFLTGIKFKKSCPNPCPRHKAAQ